MHCVISALVPLNKFMCFLSLLLYMFTCDGAIRIGQNFVLVH